MCRYHQHIADWVQSDCKLVYKNNETIRYIPGTNVPFTVEKYKEDLGLPYHKINVYLQLYEDSGDEEVELSFSTTLLTTQIL